MSSADEAHVPLTLDFIARMADVKIWVRGWMPLHSAACDGLVAECAALLDRGAPIDASQGRSGDTALGIAVNEDHIDVVRLLLQRGADVNWRNYVGDTPLHRAIRCNHIDAAVVLITIGRADLSVVNAAGKLWHQWHPTSHVRVQRLLDAVRACCDARTLVAAVVAPMPSEVWHLIRTEYAAPNPRDYGL